MTGLPCSLLLLDLDGTLVDTAPDLHAAANALRLRRGLGPLPFADFRPLVSRGGSAMLGLAFPQADATAIAEQLLPEFLTRYAEAVADHSRLFEGMAALLSAVEQAGARWGVVTNKPEGLARQLLAARGLLPRCAVLIGGDTLGVRKPDPAPLQEACRRLGQGIAGAVYVGDDPRDVQAARAAGMPVIAAAWGYLSPGEDPAGWGADAVAGHASELLDLEMLRLMPGRG